MVVGFGFQFALGRVPVTLAHPTIYESTKEGLRAGHFAKNPITTYTISQKV